jgi:hypothetical protein
LEAMCGIASYDARVHRICVRAVKSVLVLHVCTVVCGTHAASLLPRCTSNMAQSLTLLGRRRRWCQAGVRIYSIIFVIVFILDSSSW